MIDQPYWGNPRQYETGWYEVDARYYVSRINDRAYLYYDQPQNQWWWKPRWGAALRGSVFPQHHEIIAKVAIDPYLTPTIPPRVLHQYRK